MELLKILLQGDLYLKIPIDESASNFKYNFIDKKRMVM